MNKLTLVLFLMLISVAGCASQQPTPQIAPSMPQPSPDPFAQYRRWAEVATNHVPGFAGAYGSFNMTPDRTIYNCMLFVVLTDTATQGPTARKYFSQPSVYKGPQPPECGDVTTIRLRQAKYDYSKLYGWYSGIMGKYRSQVAKPDSSPRRGLLSARIDAKENRLVFSSPDESIIKRIRFLADSLSVPADRVDISEDDFVVATGAMAMTMGIRGSKPTIFFEFQVDRPARLKAGELARLEGMQKKSLGLSGELQVQFVVDPSGKPDRSTFKVLGTSDNRLPAFLAAQLSTLQYSPAEKDGRTVPQLVQTTFLF